MATTKRIYAVKQILPASVEGVAAVTRWHLVRAASPGAAIKFVAAPLFEASIPSPEDLIGYTVSGVRLVDADGE